MRAKTGDGQSPDGENASINCYRKQFRTYPDIEVLSTKEPAAKENTTAHG